MGTMINLDEAVKLNLSFPCGEKKVVWIEEGAVSYIFGGDCMISALKLLYFPEDGGALRVLSLEFCNFYLEGVGFGEEVDVELKYDINWFAYDDWNKLKYK